MSTRDHFAARWGRWLLIATVAGYGVVGLFASVMNWDSTVASYPFRVFVLLLATAMVLKLGRRSSMAHFDPWILLFGGLYLVRLMWDLAIAHVPDVTPALVFFLATCVLPGVASALAGSSALADRPTAWRLALVGGVVCTLAVVMFAFGIGDERRLDTTSMDGRLTFEALNPITLGHIAASTLIALLCLTRFRLPVQEWLVVLGIGIAAGCALLIAGSRGPIIALGFCILFYAMVTGRWRWVLLLSWALAFVAFRGDTAVISRFSSTVDDESSLERLVIQGNAILQFLDNPIFGSAYAELESLTYPHNLFIETAMAMGLVGLVVLLVVLARAFVRALRLMRSGTFLQPLLLLQYFLAAQLSGSLWGAAALWTLLALVGGVRARRAHTTPTLRTRTSNAVTADS